MYNVSTVLELVNTLSKSEILELLLFLEHWQAFRAIPFALWFVLEIHTGELKKTNITNFNLLDTLPCPLTWNHSMGQSWLSQPIISP